LFQGIAIVVFHMNRMSLGRLPRVIFWMLFFVTLAFSSIMLVGIGILDNWFKMRSITNSDNNKKVKED